MVGLVGREEEGEKGGRKKEGGRASNVQLHTGLGGRGRGSQELPPWK